MTHYLAGLRAVRGVLFDMDGVILRSASMALDFGTGSPPQYLSPIALSPRGF
jgi:hypothetical protein